MEVRIFLGISGILYPYKKRPRWERTAGPKWREVAGERSLEEDALSSGQYATIGGVVQEIIHFINRYLVFMFVGAPSIIAALPFPFP